MRLSPTTVRPAHPTGGGRTFCVRLGMYVSPRVKILGGRGSARSPDPAPLTRAPHPASCTFAPLTRAPHPACCTFAGYHVHRTLVPARGWVGRCTPTPPRIFTRGDTYIPKRTQKMPPPPVGCAGIRFYPVTVLSGSEGRRISFSGFREYATWR